MSPTPTYTADATERTDARESLTRQPDFQMRREATQLLAGGELQPKRTTREDVGELSFSDDIYQKKPVYEKPRAEETARPVAEMRVEPEVLSKYEAARKSIEPQLAEARPMPRDSQQDAVEQSKREIERPIVPVESARLSRSEQNAQDLFNGVQQQLADALNGHPDQFQKSIKKLFDYLSNFLGLDSSNGISGGGGSSWGGHEGRRGGKGGGGRGRGQGWLHQQEASEHEREFARDVVPGREREHANRAGSDASSTASNSNSIEPTINFIDGRDVQHQLWRTFRQNGFPALGDDSLILPNEGSEVGGLHGGFDARPLKPNDSEEVFCNDQNLNSFRERLDPYNRSDFESELKQLIGKYQRFEQNADQFRTNELQHRGDLGVDATLAEQRGQDILDKLAARLDASPILDDLEKSRIKFMEMSLMAGDVQNVMLLLNADDNEDMNLAMSVLDKEMRPLGIGVKYRMENGVGNMYITSNAETGYIRINRDEAEMHDGRGNVDRVFYDAG